MPAAFLVRNQISNIQDMYVKDFKGLDALFVEHTPPLGFPVLAVFYDQCRDYEEAMEYAKSHEIKRYLSN